MQKKTLFCKRTAFSLLLLLVVIMAVATFIGNSKGIDYAGRHIYYAVWFALLWAVMTACGLTWLAKSRPLHTLPLFKANIHLWLIHGAFVVILLGAVLSSLTSWSGQVHLRVGDTTNLYLSDEVASKNDGMPSREKRMPFSMTLQAFEKIDHKGTNMASNYVSRLLIDGETYTVSMNHVPTVAGVRIYQASYDSDEGGSVLMLRSDRWGQPVTYIGYALLLVAFIALLLSPHSGMRRAYREMKRAAVVALLFLSANAIQAQNGETPRTLPRPVADAFGQLFVSYGGRICPVQTLAQDFCRKIYGHPSWKGYSSEQVLTGWLLWPDDWNCAPIIEVKSRALRRYLDVPRKATFNDFFFNGYRLGPLLASEQALSQAAAEVDDRLMLIYSLRRGELFALFPVKNAAHGKTVWTTPTDTNGELSSLPQQDSLFVRNVFSKIFSDALANNYAGVETGIRTIAQFQQTRGGETLPTANIVKAEQLYNSIDLPTWLYRLNLTLGLLLFITTLFSRFSIRPMAIGFGIIGLLGFLALTGYMGLRSYISGRLPLGNGFETMLTVAWFILIIGMLLWRKARTMPTLYSIPFIASGFFLLVASLSQSNAEITQLQPVLNSPLLSLHVSVIMLSYALLTFTFLFSIAALIHPSDAERIRWQSLVVLYPAIALLAIGIFLGAVWANVSWGRYWGWDPKEVWALITMIVYALPLHSASLTTLRQPRHYHIYMLIAFATVLMTYFGVNYYLVGLHSYAG